MAFNDILPFKSPHGGITEIRYYPITVSQTFNKGELVGVVDAGTVTAFPKNATQAILASIDTVGNICGIAAFGPGAATSAADPTNFVKLNYARADGTWPVDTPVGIWPADQGILFITDNFLAAGGAATAIPAGTDVGEPYQITYGTVGTPDAGWGVEATAGAYGIDVVAVVHQVLNARKQPILSTDTTTGVYVVFEIRTGA
jgi:hypothetical protein